MDETLLRDNSINPFQSNVLIKRCQAKPNVRTTNSDVSNPHSNSIDSKGIQQVWRMAKSLIAEKQTNKQFTFKFHLTVDLVLSSNFVRDSELTSSSRSSLI